MQSWKQGVEPGKVGEPTCLFAECAKSSTFGGDNKYTKMLINIMRGLLKNALAGYLEKPLMRFF